jgi:hypothetical protein
MVVTIATTHCHRDRDLCCGRARCEVTNRRPVEGAAGVRLVDLRIAHAPSAAEDVERCDRREYWLRRQDRDLLVAFDCEAQWGAGNLGPAETRVEGTRLHVFYREFEASDQCEEYEAVVDLASNAVEKRTRWDGVSARNHCQRQNELSENEPIGDGTIERPLLTLHRP